MSALHWLFGSNSLFAKTFGYATPHHPSPSPSPAPSPPALRTVAVIVNDHGEPVKDISVALDDTPNPHTGSTNDDGYVAFTAPASLGPSQLTIIAEGFLPYSVHVDLPPRNVDLVVGTGARADQLQLTPLVASNLFRDYTRAELMDMQGDLMIWCPSVKPNFVNDFDQELRIRRVSDRGQVAQGIEAGWVWSPTVWRYPPEKREIIYATAKREGHTHYALHVAAIQADGIYHGLFPTTQAEVDGYGALLNTIHDELLDHDLIPVCCGVAPDASPAPGFDTSKALVAMTDWDNSDEASCRIKAVHEAFPRALVYYELPSGTVIPKVDACTPSVDLSSGGPWIREMVRRYPRFVGVCYEIDQPNGLDANVSAINERHAWWRDVQEVEFEIDTYWKFWENLNHDDARTYVDALRARCPFLHGTMSGGTMHDAPHPDQTTDTTIEGTGDMIDMDAAQIVDQPDFRHWPITRTIKRVELRRTGVHVEFGDDWPENVTSGWSGPLEYSLGLALNIGGTWYVNAPIEFWKGLDESGGEIQSQNVEGSGQGQIPKNWFYAPRWGTMAHYQPQPGEHVGLFVVAGDARSNFDPIKERSNVVVFPLPQSDEPRSFVFE